MEYEITKVIVKWMCREQTPKHIIDYIVYIVSSKGYMFVQLLNIHKWPLKYFRIERYDRVINTDHASVIRGVIRGVEYRDGEVINIITDLDPDYDYIHIN